MNRSNNEAPRLPHGHNDTETTWQKIKRNISDGKRKFLHDHPTATKRAENATVIGAGIAGVSLVAFLGYEAISSIQRNSIPDNGTKDLLTEINQGHVAEGSDRTYLHNITIGSTNPDNQAELEANGGVNVRYGDPEANNTHSIIIGRIPAGQVILNGVAYNNGHSNLVAISCDTPMISPRPGNDAKILTPDQKASTDQACIIAGDYITVAKPQTTP